MPWLKKLRAAERRRVLGFWGEYRKLRKRAGGGEIVVPIRIAARLLDVSPQAAHQLFARDKLPAFEFGDRLFVMGADVEECAQRETWKRRGRLARETNWKPEEEKLLGVQPDGVVAKKLGRRQWDVMRRRWKLGIKPFRWTTCKDRDVLKRYEESGKKR